MTGNPAERRCLELAPINVLDDAYYFGAVRLQPGALKRLLFVAIDGDIAATHVIGADMIEGPWTTLDVLPDVRPGDIGDLDGDGLDDVIMEGADPRWWGPDASGTLSDRGPIIDEGQSDALFLFPGDAKAGRAHGSGALAIARGHGDGTFAESVFTEPPTPDDSFTLPVTALGDAMISAVLHDLDCYWACNDPRVAVRVEPDGTLTSFATTIPYEYILGIGDLEPDGMVDLFTHGPEAELYVRRGTSPATRDVLVGGYGFEVGDFDGDGATDVLIAESAGTGVRWNEGGTLANVTTVLDATASESYGLNAPVDLDGDAAHEVVLDAAGSAAVLHAIPCD